MIRTNLVALLALVPAVALAQAPGMAAPPGPGGGAPPAASAPATAAPASPAASTAAEPIPSLADDLRDSATGTAAPDTYTVKPGDTLWDLSGRFLNNPWYWPKIWSYNPEITNPHWIYPGNLLRFFPAAEEGPGRVEPVAPGTPIAAADEEPAEEAAEPVKELEDFSRADLKAPAADSDVVAVAGPYKIGQVQRRRWTRHDAFLTARELAASGTIQAAFEEKSMLSHLDRAYARFEKQADVKVGESYVVYRTERAVVHPVTKELFGYHTIVLGSAKVVAVSDKAATLVIGQTFEPIERGALLGPLTQKFVQPVDRKPNRQALDGRIVGTRLDVLTQLGQNNVVFVDRGEKDGVQEGNVFTVVRSGEQYRVDSSKGTWDPNLPVEPIGELLVVDVKEHASAALVTRSLKELLVGDRVEMRPDAGSGGN